MSGLTDESVSELVDAIAKGRDRYFDRQFHESALALNEVLLLIEKFRTENDRPQPSRPDRIGDECWYESRICDFINGSSHWSSKWQRGVLRCWDHSSSNCIAMVEDCETHDIIATANLCFAAEDPNKPAKKPQD